MDLPLCKICGDRHRLGGCPQFNAGRDQRAAWLKGMVSGAPKAQPSAQADQHPQAPGPPETNQAPQAQIETPVAAPGTCSACRGEPREGVEVNAPRHLSGSDDEATQTAKVETGGGADAAQAQGRALDHAARAPEKPKFDRNAYQKELMRKRRAAAKNK